MQQTKSKIFLRGMRDGIPIALGYFVVAFSLGIHAKQAGLNWFQGYVMSFVTHASAGEKAGLISIGAGNTLWLLALFMLVANARYLLMSTALSQKIRPELSIWQRMVIGFCVTDELFGVSVAYPGYLDPAYLYGAALSAIPSWALGTALGIVAGELLPALAVTALSAAIYGMFLAVIIPPCRADKRLILVVAASLLISWLTDVIPAFAALSARVSGYESYRVIVLTVVISAAAAILMPHDEEVAQ